MAAEADDSELKDAANGRGWVAQIIKLSRQSLQDRYKRQVEDLKTEIRRMATRDGSTAGAGVQMDFDAVVNSIDKIMGLA